MEKTSATTKQLKYQKLQYLKVEHQSERMLLANKFRVTSNMTACKIGCNKFKKILVNICEPTSNTKLTYQSYSVILRSNSSTYQSYSVILRALLFFNSTWNAKKHCCQDCKLSSVMICQTTITGVKRAPKH